VCGKQPARRAHLQQAAHRAAQMPAKHAQSMYLQQQAVQLVSRLSTLQCLSCMQRHHKTAFWPTCLQATRRAGRSSFLQQQAVQLVTRQAGQTSMCDTLCHCVRVTVLVMHTEAPKDCLLAQMPANYAHSRFMRQPAEQL
jgi:hypothetical protein